MAATPEVTDALVAFSCRPAAAGASRVPDLVRSLLDTVGVALAGRASVDALERWSATEPTSGRSTVWGRSGTTAASRAALVNGTAAHALDFDDAVPTMPLHPSAVLWPAVLAAAEARGSTWDDALAAVDAGNAVLRAVTETLPSDVHYARGWHTTATVGRIAAVCALVRLARLDDTVARHALGIVASMAAGSRAGFGTATKPLHAGLAAHDAVVAVGLAEAGVDSHPGQLDHPLGFLALYGDAADRSRFAERLAHWADAWPTAWSVKRHPSCYATHYAVDAALLLRPEIPDLEAITRVDVRVHPGSLRPLIDHVPSTGLEAKFSLQHTVASALVDGALGLESFGDDAVRRHRVTDLCGRVEVAGVEAPHDLPAVAGAAYAHVRVALADGSAVERLVTVTHGDAHDPLTDAELDEKVVGCAASAGWSLGSTGHLLHVLGSAARGGDVDLTVLRQEGTR